MEYIAKNVPLWSVTTWDKKFIGVESNWQTKTIKYKYLLSDELNRLRVDDGDVRILYTGKDIGFTTLELAKDYISEGEIVSIPWGGIPTVKYYKGKFVTGDNRIATSSKPNELLNKYLYYFMMGHISEIASFYRGASLKHPSMKDVLNMKISYPSVYEQERIIKKLDLLESIINKCQLQIEKLDTLVKSRFVEMFGDIVHDDNIPKVLLSELADIGSSKRIFANEYVDDGIPFYRSKEIRELGSGLKPTTELFITNERYKEIKKKYGVPKTGDILIAAIGATIGYSWIVDTEKPFYYKDGNLIILSVKDNVNSVFLNHTMGIIIEDFKNKGVSGSAQLALTIEKLEKMPIVNPDLTLQNQFAAFVEQTDKSKSAVKQVLEKAETLKKALMQEYFG